MSSLTPYLKNLKIVQLRHEELDLKFAGKFTHWIILDEEREEYFSSENIERQALEMLLWASHSKEKILKQVSIDGSIETGLILKSIDWLEENGIEYAVKKGTKPIFLNSDNSNGEGGEWGDQETETYYLA